MGCEFDRPLDDSSACIMTAKDVANGKLRDHYDLVRLMSHYLYVRTGCKHACPSYL